MIFCVEDDANIRNLLLYALNAAGFDAEGFSDSTLFWNAVAQKLPDLIILDIMLPGEDGISILKKLRARFETADIPVIMASAKCTEYDKVFALDLGADDYLVKPYGMMEMISRVKAVLRRAAPKNNPTILRVGKLTMNTNEHTVDVDGQRVTLTLKEYTLLQIFMKNLGIAYNREQLLRLIWGNDFIGETRTVDVHIGTLRTKLGPCADYIQTIRGIGYRMEAAR